MASRDGKKLQTDSTEVEVAKVAEHLRQIADECVVNTNETLFASIRRFPSRTLAYSMDLVGSAFQKWSSSRPASPKRRSMFSSPTDSRTHTVTRPSPSRTVNLTNESMQTRPQSDWLTDTSMQTRPQRGSLTNESMQTRPQRGSLTNESMQTRPQRGSLTNESMQTRPQRGSLTNESMQTRPQRGSLTNESMQTRPQRGRLTNESMQTRPQRGRLTDTSMQTRPQSDWLTDTSMQTRPQSDWLTDTSMQTRPQSDWLTDTAVQTVARVVDRPKPSTSYTCYSCGSQEKARPRLFVTTEASFNPTSPNLLDVRVFIHDERLRGSEVGASTLDLLGSHLGSRVYVRLRLPKNSWMRHCLDDDGNHLFTTEKSCDLSRLLSCRKCMKKEKDCQLVFTHKWLLQRGEDLFQTAPSFHAVVDVSHLHASQIFPTWEATSSDDLEKVTTVDFHVECPKIPGFPEDRSAWEKKLLLLNEGQLERVARALGIPDAQLLSLKQRCSSPQKFRDELQEVCMTQGTTGTGLFIPVIADLVSEASRTQQRSLPTPDRHSHSKADISEESLASSIGGAFRMTPVNLEQHGKGNQVEFHSVQTTPGQGNIRFDVPRTDSGLVMRREAGLADTVQMSYLKSFEEADPPPSYHSHFENHGHPLPSYTVTHRPLATVEDTTENSPQVTASQSPCVTENLNEYVTEARNECITERQSERVTELQSTCVERRLEIPNSAVQQCNLVTRAVGQHAETEQATWQHSVNLSPVVGRQDKNSMQDTAQTLTSVKDSLPTQHTSSGSSSCLLTTSSVNLTQYSAPSSLSSPPVNHLDQLELLGAQTVVNDLKSPQSYLCSQSSGSSSVCMEFTISLSDTDNESVDTCQAPDYKKQPLTELLMKSSETLPENLGVCHGTTATQTEPHMRSGPSPIVCRQWQACFDFTHEGGSLHTEFSDVLLHVPPGAVQNGPSVDVLAAVCANVNQIRHVLQLPEDEEILSPLAEYCAGHGFRFRQPVFITLPHALPTGYDTTQVNVYRVSLGDQGGVVVTKLRHIDTQPASGDVRDSSPSFCLPAPGQVRIVTDCFSGYVCTYSSCGLHQEGPVLHAMVCSSHSKDDDGQQVAVYTYIWDERLSIKDFQKECGIGKKKEILNKAVLPLMEDIDNTKLCLRLQLLGKGAKNWVRMSSPGAPAHDPFPFQKSVDIRRVLSCDRSKCQARKVCSQPVSIVWALETVPECPPGVTLTLTCAVLIAHVPSSMSLSDCFEERETLETFYVEIKEDPGDWNEGGTGRRTLGRRARASPSAAAASPRLSDAEDEDNSFPSKDDVSSGWKRKRRQNHSSMTYDHDDTSASSTTKTIDRNRTHPSNIASLTKRSGKGNTSESSCSVSQTRKYTQKIVPLVSSKARGNRPAQICGAKQRRKLSIENLSYSSDAGQNYSAYNSSSETEVKQRFTRGQSSGRGDGDDSSDDHYEDIEPIARSASFSRSPPSLPDRPARAALPGDPSALQAHSLPSTWHQQAGPALSTQPPQARPALSTHPPQAHPALSTHSPQAQPDLSTQPPHAHSIPNTQSLLQNVGPAHSLPQSLLSPLCGADAEQHPPSNTTTLSGATGAEGGEGCSAETHMSAGREENTSSQRTDQVAEYTPVDEAKETSCRVM
ncbi:uncharacterized protein LOC143287722 [Babylonia areolata]|uniref:uncharacterized protein LOC143287722 n=1 Tax=Babylonia areolata TaxID=304850 RepID=UPI003FD192F8